MRIILCGFGVVSQSFAQLLESRTHDLYSKFGLNPRIVGVFDSKGCAYDEAGLDLKKLNKIKTDTGTVRGYDKKNKQITGKEIINNIDADVLIETTASNYKDAEPGMSHIISAMKRKCMLFQ